MSDLKKLFELLKDYEMDMIENKEIYHEFNKMEREINKIQLLKENK